ncbi:multiheme c-type cytochrome [Paracoccus litorisediminis]|nr:multiheme c-type cytochrome [Paracoccus litorisediminis]
MKIKTQLRYHARPLLAALLVAVTALAAYAALAPRPAPVGVAATDVPFYRLPFGPDDTGQERLFWPSRIRSASGAFSDPTRLPSAADCASCHQQEFHEWAGSLHAIADRDLIYEATVDANVDSVRNPEQGRFCEGCHAPNEMLTGRVNRFVSVQPADALTEGVTCITCHTAIHAQPETGNGAITLAYNRAEYDQDGLTNAALLANPRDHLAAYGAPDTTALMKSSDLCGACHVEIYDHSMSKARSPQVAQSTFLEWRDSWYGQQGVTCQACHMADDPAAQVMAIRNGDLSGPKRFSHRFVGANHLLTDTGMGDTLDVLRGGALPGVSRDLNRDTLTEQARQTEALLRAAAGLELRDQQRRGDTLHLAVAVQNLGAGHNLPTGVNDQKHMWLELTLTDAQGRTLYRSGGPDEAETVAWIEHFQDSKGRRITDHLTFSTAEVNWVRRPIPAKGEDVATYDIPLDGAAQGPLHLTARLEYRVALPDLLYRNLRREMAVPPFTLAELSTDLTDNQP